MAETLVIEIPIEAVDRTSAGVQSATRNLTAFERAWQRTQQRLDRLERTHYIDLDLHDNASQGLSSVEDQTETLDAMDPEIEINASNGASSILNEVEDQAEMLDGTSSDVDVGANDTATGILNGVEDAAEMVDGTNAEVDIGANDTATGVINDAGDAVAALDGDTATVTVEADDNATPAVSAASDAVEAFDGMSGSAEIGASDNASPVVAGARDQVEQFSGMSGSAEIGAEDNATPVIAAAEDRAAAWDGSVWTATLKIVDAATAPIQAAIDAVKNPIAQAGALLGVSVGLGDTIDTYKNYEAMMSQVKAISGATGAEFEALNQKAKQMGADTKFSAYESAEAFNYMAMAGWKTDDMIGGIEGIMALAAASGEALGSTSDIVTDALTAFGLKASDASHFADVLAQASSNANTNVGMLGESFKYVAPVAGAMNYSVEDTSLALGLMANASIKGSMAGTALKTSLANMASPTDSMAEAMEKYGISLTDSEGNMKSLNDVMKNLRSSLRGLSETEQTAAASTIFGKEAMAGMLAIINASEEDYNKLSEAVYNADGAAKQMADTMMDNLAGSLELLGGAVDEVKMSLGERLSPYLAGAADALAEQMPGIKDKIGNIMDYIDEKAAGVKQTISTMISSDEWEEADLFGKIDIAWDTLIAEPFLEWAGGTGKTLMSEGLSTLFSEAAKILPGGEDAGIMSWLSAGVIAKGATGLIDGAGKIVTALKPIGGVIADIGEAAANASSLRDFVGNIGDMIPMSGKIGIAAAGIAAAVVLINKAIDDYNQKTLSDNLAEHFGQIELSAKQAELLAEQVLTQEWLVNVEVALGEVEKADQLAADAEKILNENRVLEWKSKVGIKMDPDEQAVYTENIEKFADDKIKELESRSYVAYLHVQTFLGGTEEGMSLADNILEWANADNLELSELSSQLSDKVAKALEDGIISAPEEEAIHALQGKMNSIVSRWKEAESAAQLAWIKNEYGTMSAEDLTAGGFENLITALRERQQTGYEKLQADYEQFYAELAAMNKAGRISGGVDAEGNAYGEFGRYVELASQTTRNQKASDISEVTGTEVNTMQNTYGSKISENLEAAEEKMQSITEGLKYRMQMGQNGLIAGDLDSAMKDLSFGDGTGWFGAATDADQSNLSRLWTSIEPDAQAMTRIMDEYVAAGQAVPESFKKGYLEMMEVGMAAGDADAAWQMYAHELMASGDQAMIDAVQEMDKNGFLPEEFSAALKRELTETVADGSTITLDDIQAKAKAGGLEVMDKDEWVSSLNEKLGDLAEVSDVTAEDITIKVKSGDCLWEIGEALGMDWKTIAEQNGIESPYTIYPDQELVISRDGIDVDASPIGDAIDSAMSALTAEGAEFTVSADGVTVDLTDVQVDPDTAMAQIEAALGMAAGTLNGADIDIQTGGTVTIPQELVNVDTSGMNAAVEAAVETEPVETHTSAKVIASDAATDASGAKAASDAQVDTAFSVPHDTNSHVDVTLDQSNNADAIYNEVYGEVTGKFGAGYSVTAPVAVTLDWKLINPTANISVGGAGTGNASVSASLHAAGGEVGQNGPELSWVGEEGLEYIIPTVPARRGRGIALWEQAGQALGVLDSSGNVAAHANGGIVGPSGEVRAADAIIPLQAEQQEADGSVWSVTGKENDPGRKEAGQNEEIAVNAATPQAPGNNNVEIKVDMSPVIQIDGSGMDEEKIVEVLKSRIREMADELGGELAEKMTKIFANMPLVQEA